jgi:hypothetical protein
MWTKEMGGGDANNCMYSESCRDSAIDGSCERIDGHACTRFKTEEME